ncbi:MAG: IS481 family transposase [Anaeromyxobacteraceae bacterium]
MSERLEFVKRWEQGERVVDLCYEFGISRKTAYKLRERYEEDGARALFDRSHAPRRIPHRTPAEVEKFLVEFRQEHPTWGPKKIRAHLLLRQPELAVPCASTIGDILKRNGVMLRKRRRRSVMPRGAPLRKAERPNDIWCADFKGEFKLGTGRYCYPLTITDRFSRYLIRCEALEGTHVDTAITVFDQAFREFGLPLVIRTDNGNPFAAPGLWGLSRLSARWLRLGIWPERIAPAHPEQNGQHERMHLVLKEETTRPAGDNLLQQQERFDKFIDVYNHDRPHEALGQKLPADFYVKSGREMPEKLPEPEYPMHDRVQRVRGNGDIVVRKGERFFLSTVLVGELVGMREIDDGRWVVSFMQLDLGHFDARTKRFTAIGTQPQEVTGTEAA